MIDHAPELEVFGSRSLAEARATDIIIAQVEQKPESVLTLPTGTTPIGVYRRLVQAHEQGLDFSGTTVFNLDEYWPISNSHRSSYASYMDKQFFDHVNIPIENRHIPNGSAENVSLEAARYEMKIRELIIDLAFISIGPGRTCHIGFNEPGSLPSSQTRCVELTPETLEANCKNFDDDEEMPTGAITQGIKTILVAKQILLLATGESKAWGINRSLSGEISPEAPASFLRYHSNVSFVLDADAASQITPEK